MEKAIFVHNGMRYMKAEICRE